jgi:hypothetical protein
MSVACFLHSFISRILNNFEEELFCLGKAISNCSSWVSGEALLLDDELVEIVSQEVCS